LGYPLAHRGFKESVGSALAPEGFYLKGGNLRNREIGQGERGRFFPDFFTGGRPGCARREKVKEMPILHPRGELSSPRQMGPPQEQAGG